MRFLLLLPFVLTACGGGGTDKDYILPQQETETVVTPPEVVTPSNPAEGTVLDSYCDMYIRVVTTADGNGGELTVETPNSPDCGYNPPPAGELKDQYCQDTTLVSVYHDGDYGEYDEFKEKAEECGYIIPEEGTVLNEYCEGTTLVQEIADGNDAYTVSSFEKDEETCGYVRSCPVDPTDGKEGFPYINCDGVYQRTDVEFPYTPGSTHINTIDILIIFDENLETELTPEEFVKREIDFVNQKFVDSGVYIQMKVAAIEITNISTTTSFRTLITQLGDGTDAFNWVDDFQLNNNIPIAFVFLQPRDPQQTCGVAYVNGTRGLGATRGMSQCFQDTVFQPDWKPRYQRANETIAHEIGHILGLEHDWANATNSYSLFDYSFGYDAGNGLGTIMSYSDEALGVFSHPTKRVEIDDISHRIGTSGGCFALGCEPEPATNAQEHLNRVRVRFENLIELIKNPPEYSVEPELVDEEICIF